MRTSQVGLALAVIALSSCHGHSAKEGECPSVFGRNPIDDARYDFRHGERYLMTFTEGGVAAMETMPGAENLGSCYPIYDKRGNNLRVNPRFKQLSPTSDDISQKDEICIIQEPKYVEAYNRELLRLAPQAYLETCSALSLKEATKRFGDVDPQTSQLSVNP